MSHRFRPRFGALVGTLVLSLVAVAAPATANDPPVLAIDFQEGTKGSALTMPKLRGTGSSQLSSRVITEAKGRALVAKAVVSADGRSLRFPDYALLRRPSTPLAVLRVRNAKSRDKVAVGSRSFAWSADFRLAEDLGNDHGDGDNLVQRGLWGDRAQWKLSVDSHRAQCSLGFGDRRVTTPTVQIPNDRWYRAICRRRVISDNQARLTLTVKRWNGSRFVSFKWVRSTKNAQGRLNFNRVTPVSVGGKLKRNGSLHPQPDQFNGRVDRVRLWVG